MAIIKTARFSVRPEELETCRSAIREFVSQVRSNEPDTLLYISASEKNEPTRFLHWMVFEDERAEQRHRDSEWVRRFTEVLYPRTVDGVHFTDYERVSSNLSAERVSR